MAESPYQAPESNVTPKPAGTEEEQDLATFVGPKNTDYYLRRFRKIEAGSSASWHWPAFFITGPWLLYRKMWLMALGYILGLPILTGMLSGVFALFVGPVSATLISYLVWGIVALIVIPIFANSWYKSRADAKIAAIDAKGLDDASRQREIASRGGVNWWAPWLFLLVPFAMLGVIAAIAIPAYQDYTIRAQVSEGIGLSEVPKQAIVSYHEENGEFPPHNLAAGLPAPEDVSGLYVSSVTVDGSLIIINYGGEAHEILQGRALLVGLDADALPSYRWLCGSDDIEPRHLPSACREE